MPFHRAARRAAALAVAAVCLLPLGPGASASDDDHRRSPGLDPVSERAGMTARQNPLLAAEYTGVDGQVHKKSPILVRGRHGTTFFGEEFDGACGYGKQFDQGMKRLSQLARVIERSGRRVVFTIPPNKSAVVKSDLRKNRLPHPRCDLLGLAQQDRVLDDYRDPSYVPLRRTLAAQAAAGQRHLYWPIDTHWTRLGAQALVQGVAAHLDPKLADRQRSRRGEETIRTDLSYLGVIPETYETGPAAYTTTQVAVTPVPGTVAYDPEATVYPQHEWTTKPASDTWRGRTLVIGDSFAYRALDNLMPLFNHGTFVWVGQMPLKKIVAAVPAADTVVIEVTQRYMPITPILRAPFRNHVRKAIASASASASRTSDQK